MPTITATAPAKTILLGEHAVNRGQTALSVSVGLYATCTLSTEPSEATGNSTYHLISDNETQITSREDIIALGNRLDAYLADSDYINLQQLVAIDFFAPAKYVLAAIAPQLPDTLTIHLHSNIPHGSGLGSGGAIFVALATTVSTLLSHSNPTTPTQLRQIANWAVRGDIIAHGGTASGLDTQTSLYGGCIRYTAINQGEPIPYAAGLSLVVGNTNIYAPTSQVNARVRAWLADRPSRIHYFQEIGVLSRQAELALHAGDWHKLGHLINLNQLLLERIGVSCPELEKLNEAALDAGALGAKLSGSGGGGIMFALVTPDKLQAVTHAIANAGGTTIIAPTAVPGCHLKLA